MNDIPLKTIGRPVTLKEALVICLQVLEDAERERLETAELEASRGIENCDE